MPKITKKCLICGKEFSGYPSRMTGKRGIYCSSKCLGISHMGNKFATATKGKYYAMRNRFGIGDKHFNWKGDSVSYRSLHHWIEKHLGKPTICEICGKQNLTGREIHWANKDHKYQRKLSDWMRVCKKCHGEYDIYRELRKHKNPLETVCQ